MKILEWIDIKEKPLPNLKAGETLLVSHSYGVELLYLNHNKNRLCYHRTEVDIGKETIALITHWCKPEIVQEPWPYHGQ